MVPLSQRNCGIQVQHVTAKFCGLVHLCVGNLLGSCYQVVCSLCNTGIEHHQFSSCGGIAVTSVCRDSPGQL